MGDESNEKTVSTGLARRLGDGANRSGWTMSTRHLRIRIL